MEQHRLTPLVTFKIYQSFFERKNEDTGSERLKPRSKDIIEIREKNGENRNGY